MLGRRFALTQPTPAQQNRSTHPCMAASADAAEPLEFVTVSLGFNPCGAEARSLRSLWRAGRTILLLAGAACASIAMVDLPTPAASATGSRAMALTAVPASDKWISLGAKPSFPSKARAAAAEPRVGSASVVEPRRARRKPRGAQVRSIGRKMGRLDCASLTGGGGDSAASGDGPRSARRTQA